MQFISDFVDYFQASLPALLSGQALTQAGIIVILFGLFTSKAARLLIATAIAAIVYVAVEVIYPAAVEGRDFVLPVFNMELLYHLITLYLVLLLPIALVFGVKTLIGTVRS